MSDREVASRVLGAVTAAASDHPGLAVRTVHVVRGWGDILFVRIEAEVAHQQTRSGMVRNLRALVAEALPGERHTVSVSWVDQG